MKRRRFLLFSALASVAAGAAYSLQRGLRYPSLGFELPALSTRLRYRQCEIVHHDAIRVAGAGEALRFRASVPEPELVMTATGPTELSVLMENISTAAQLHVAGAVRVDEKADGLQRQVRVGLRSDAPVRLRWQWPDSRGYRFAAIGDSGGGAELAWCLRRAHELGASFLLHLGDFNYRQQDYQLARANLLGSAIPVFATIGNHDYRDDGIYFHDTYRTRIGPLNSRFQLGGVCFLNIDTANDFFPASGGHRGALVDSLQPDRRWQDVVTYTHRPMVDPRPDHTHTIGRGGQIPWLAGQFKRLGIDTMLAGHVHTKGEVEYQGIKNYVAGQGMALEDLIAERSFAEMLIGEVEPGRKVEYRWQPLLMPFDESRDLENVERMTPAKMERLRRVLPG